MKYGSGGVLLAAEVVGGQVGVEVGPAPAGGSALPLHRNLSPIVTPSGKQSGGGGEVGW